MDAVTLGELAVVVGGELLETNPHDVFRSVSTDSRRLKPGDVFWALAGPNHDGHDFVQKAKASGARAVVVSRTDETTEGCVRVADVQAALTAFAAWYRATLPATVVGVTGSVGKTTCRTMIHDVLAARCSVGQSPDNFNNHLGVPLSLLQASAADDYFVVELGASAAGEIQSLAEIAGPEIGVVTAVAEAHLEGFGDLQAVQRAKGELVEALPGCGTAFLNGDDLLVRALADRAACEVKLFGEALDCDIRAEAVVAGEDGLRFQVDGFTYTVPVAGRHQLPNALAAIGTGREAGLLPGEIQQGLAAFLPPCGRCRVRRFGESALIDDSYNASPKSVVAAAELLAGFAGHARRVLILGDMSELGPDAVQLHRETGRNCGRAGDIDLLVAVGVFADAVVQGAKSGGVSEAVAFENQSQLTETLSQHVLSGDAVLVKGSRAAGMERVVALLAEQFGATPENRSVA